MTQWKTQGTKASMYQHNQMRAKILSATRDRKEVFKDMIEYFKPIEGLVGVTIGGDYNQNIESN